MQEHQYQDKNIIELFKSISELKELTNNQNKVLMAEDIEAYMSVEAYREKLRKKINAVKNDLSLSLEEYGEYVKILNEMLKLEENNRRIIFELQKNIKNEEKSFMTEKKIMEKYFNKNMIKPHPRFISKIT